MDLDKDFSGGDTTVYGPDTCSFVPRCVNNLSSNKKANRGKYPVGVSWNTDHKKFFARACVGDGNRIKIGAYDCPDEAFSAYKEFKEAYIKRMAKEQYDLGNITEVVYKTLLNFEIIDDRE